MGIIVLVAFSPAIHAKWVQTNGPLGGGVSALAVMGNIIFAGTWLGGVYRSTDNGSNWIGVNKGITNADVRSFAVNGSTIFTATMGGGVFRSTDSGTTWTAVNNGLRNKDVLSLAVFGPNLFAGTYGSGVFLSTNSGSDWVAAYSNASDHSIYVSSFAVIGGNIFAGTLEGVFRSIDSGTTWSAVNSGLTRRRVNSLAVMGGNLFAGTEPDGGVFLSTDKGTSWTGVNAGLTNIDVMSLAVVDDNLFAGTYLGGVFLSINKGTTWIAVNDGLNPKSSITSFAVIGGNIYVGPMATGSDWSGKVSRRLLSEMLDLTSIQQLAGTTHPTNFNLVFKGNTTFSATIEFSLPCVENVTLSVYNLSGVKIATLANKIFKPGLHQVSWPTATIATGCYTVRMQSDSKCLAKTLPIF
jgi:hypothetical protein